MAQGAERRGGVGLLDGRSDHGSICSYLFVTLDLCVRYGIFEKLEVVVKTRRQKGRFVISGFLSERDSGYNDKYAAGSVPKCKRRGCWNEKKVVSRLVTEVVAGVCWSKQILPERVSFAGLFGSIDDTGEKRVGS